MTVGRVDALTPSKDIIDIISINKLMNGRALENI